MAETWSTHKAVLDSSDISPPNIFSIIKISDRETTANVTKHQDIGYQLQVSIQSIIHREIDIFKISDYLWWGGWWWQKKRNRKQIKISVNYRRRERRVLVQCRQTEQLPELLSDFQVLTFQKEIECFSRKLISDGRQVAGGEQVLRVLVGWVC